MNYSNLFGGFALVLVVFLGGYVFSHSTVNPVVDKTPPVGAIAGPDIASPYLNVNGVATYYYRSGMANASTTCSFKAPAATSTLVSANAYLASASGATVQMQIANDPNRYSTTTAIALNAASVLTTFLQATSTGSSLTDGNIVPPNTFINVKIGSSSPTVRGTCEAVLRVI